MGNAAAFYHSAYSNAKTTAATNSRSDLQSWMIQSSKLLKDPPVKDSRKEDKEASVGTDNAA